MIENQDISVIIPTLDNPEMVDKVISKLNNQTLLPQEIIISDSSSGDEIEKSFSEDTINEIQKRVEDVVDQVKISAQPVPVVLVGGGSILVRNSFDGASNVLRPPDAEVANAIGAAISQVGGQVEKVYSLTDMSRDEALDLAKDEATQKAVEAGGDPKSIEIVDIEEIPLTYLPSNALRVKVKAVGNLI